jgi:hypothetical protein
MDWRPDELALASNRTLISETALHKANIKRRRLVVSHVRLCLSVFSVIHHI